MAKARFEWDAKKDQENRKKHGVRMIAEDLSHSSSEKRYYCFGWVDGGVMTVRFTYRDDVIRIVGPVTGAEASKHMGENIRYTDEPLGRLKVVPDFLPRPEDLVFRDEGVKVTIALSKRSVEFFKNGGGAGDSVEARPSKRARRACGVTPMSASSVSGLSR